MYCRQEFPDSKHGHEMELPVAHLIPRVKKGKNNPQKTTILLKTEITKLYQRPICQQIAFVEFGYWQRVGNFSLNTCWDTNNSSINTTMVTPPLCFNSFKEVSHEPVLSAMLVLRGTQVDLKLKWEVWSNRTNRFFPLRSPTTQWVLNLNGTWITKSCRSSIPSQAPHLHTQKVLHISSNQKGTDFTGGPPPVFQLLKVSTP